VTARLPLARPDTGAAEAEAVAAVLASGWLGRGEQTERFERAVAERTGADHAVAVATGTAALHVAVMALGLGPGDEVIVPSLTYAATHQAIAATGARPVFADIDPDTWCLDPVHAATRVGPATRAIMTVHYGGDAAGRPAVAELANRHGLSLVEDAAHAFGSIAGPSASSPRVGGTGNPVCFSFDPIKALTCGQGGAITTDDPDLARRAGELSDLGLAGGKRRRDQIVLGPGLRYAMSDLNAAIGLAQLEGFDDRVRRRRELWRRYAAALSTIDGVVLPRHDPALLVPFLFAVRVLDGRREHVRATLDAAGIESGVRYPPGHRQPYFTQFVGPDLRLPVTDVVSDQLLSLPFFVGMSDTDVDRVVSGVATALRS